MQSCPGHGEIRRTGHYQDNPAGSGGKGKDPAVKASSEKKSLFPFVLGVIVLLFVGYWWLQLYFYRNRSGQYVACRSNLSNIGTALEMYSTDFAGRYPSALDSLRPAYLQSIPTCPSAGKPSYSYSACTAPDRFTVYCAGTNHRTDAGPDEPCYSSDLGLLPMPLKEKILQWLDAHIP
jgi:hypothetical protein